MPTRLPHLTTRLQGFGETIFAEMSRLAAAHDAVNLGQGFPDFDPPQEITEAAVEAIRVGHNQYAPGDGIAPLRRAVADHQRRFWDLDYDPDTEVTVCAGATEGVCAAVLALCDTGDEVILFEPYYDSYLGSVAMAGGVPRPVTLRRPEFRFDPDDLAAVVGPRTKLVIVNSPHNPTGSMLDPDQLEALAQVCVDHDLIAVTDDVYEHLVYDGTHTPLAAMPGMRERTVAVSSAAKTFSVTGWKVGWACAAPALTQALRAAKQWMTYTNNTPGQHAIVRALTLGDSYYTDLAERYRARRDRLVAGLRAAGLEPYPSRATYYVVADVTALGFADDVAFCRQAPASIGVAAVPCSGFYRDPRRGSGLVRFAFCKTDAVLDEGIARLARLGKDA